jgi:septal ring-binding cell division protein DamX
VLLVLLVSMSVFGYMYKEMVLQEVEALKKYLLRGTPAVPAPEEAASAAAAASAASAEALAAAELAASMAAEAARVASEAQEVASAASAAASVAAPTASEPVVAASAEEPVKKKTEKELKADKAQAKKETKAEAKAEPSSDEAWVDQLPANAYVVQLAAMDTQEDMRSFQRSNAVYAKARILRARQKDSTKRYYILVAGPFDSKSQADAFMQSSPLLAKGWLRSSKSMKTQFTKS